MRDGFHKGRATGHDEPVGTELTEKETLLLELLAQGEEYKDMIEPLGLSGVPSVKNLGRRALLKLGADNKTHAVALALRRKLIQ